MTDWKEEAELCIEMGSALQAAMKASTNTSGAAFAAHCLIHITFAQLALEGLAKPMDVDLDIRSCRSWTKEKKLVELDNRRRNRFRAVINNCQAIQQKALLLEESDVVN